MKIFYLFCFAGNARQVYQCITDYLAFPTITHIYIEDETQTFPGISIAIPFPGKTADDPLVNAGLHDGSCNMVTRRLLELNITQGALPLKVRDVFFGANSTHFAIQFSSNTSLQPSYAENVKQVRINGNIGDSYEIAIHDPLKPFIRKTASFSARKIRRLSLFYTYVKQTLHLLPSPYSTKCKHYPFHGYPSQEHCYLICLARRASKRCKKNYNVNCMLSRSQVGIPPKCLPTGESKTQCADLCSQPDCTISTYRLVLQKSAPLSVLSNNSENFDLVNFVEPLNPWFFIFTVMPKLGLLDVIVDISNILAFWFGVSIYISLSAGIELLIKTWSD